MTRDILTTCEGWTPIIDIIAQELGLLTAATYGVVWRHCQMRSGVCYASVESLAGHLGISVKSVRRRLVQLCGAGYLEDTTPDVRNKPHVYRDTARVELGGSVKVVVSQSDQPLPFGWSESPTGWSESPTDSVVRESTEDTKDTMKQTNGGGDLSKKQQQAADCLKALGVNGSQKLALAWDPEVITTWCAYAEAHGLGPGFVIEKLRSGDVLPAPPQTETAEQRGQRLREERHARYKRPSAQY